ncbi:exodeoxyribonuclease V subunit gamma [soil metagenome]
MPSPDVFSPAPTASGPERPLNDAIAPGLLVLHGNRLELLKEAVVDWLARQPLNPLEEEIFLVQSNGVAEWLKMALAQAGGICAAVKVELPARFLWRSYRQVLGNKAVPAHSPLDKAALTWRLMRLLPERAAEPGFEPLAGFLNPAADTGRRLQLAQKLADLYDQYQVYRADWLDAWANGRDVIQHMPGSRAEPLPDNQLWQARLWREVLQELTPTQQATARPELHRRFIEALESDQPAQQKVARRVVLFGMSHVPMQTLEALSALSSRSQVLLAIPNPCRYHWADIIEGRELLKSARRRHSSRGADLAAVALEDLHSHANPLLAAWGRQGRDFVRQLDAFDDSRAALERFAIPRIDLFNEEEGDGDTLLQKVQARVRDLVPLAEHDPEDFVDDADRSIVFHVAHGVQREVEVLHDQLLALLADADGSLKPRDIVVMVPEIDSFAASIRAVFGQYQRSDPRFIPFDISDLQQRGNNPVVVAMEWLLRLPQQRCRLAEIRDLLDVPAVAARFGIDADMLPRLTQWMDGAGVRWGLHADQRAGLGLDTCGEQNTWLFGLRRMLLGYASGDGAAFDGIEPYGEVGGLEAAMAGSLASLVQALMGWWQLGANPATPAEWAEHGRALLVGFLKPVDEGERLTVAALQDALRRWLDDCEMAGFDEPVPLAVMREAWLGGLDEPSLGRRFLAGGVTFCTLLPMRAVPFEVVCLLGMNDGDYPRSTARSDFDLMGWPGQRRPGDRSRRDDDRYLMLEAVLAARRVLYVSWSGRSARDNSEQPPSVLVSQLRDYLRGGWGREVVEGRTTEHPLQPFSRRYFQEPDGDERELFTYAREWRAAHGGASSSASTASAMAMPPFEQSPDVPLTVQSLAAFLRDPVKQFFRDRLDVRFEDAEAAPDDDEAFAIAGLDEYKLLDELLDGVDTIEQLDERAWRVHRSGKLPIGRQGEHVRQRLVDALTPMLGRWAELRRDYAVPAAKEPLRFESEGVAIDDWLDGMFTAVGGSASSQAPAPRARLQRVVSQLTNDKAEPRADRLIDAWVRMLVASSCGVEVTAVAVGRDAVLTLRPLPQDQARERLEELMRAWRDGMLKPLPLARRTAIAWVTGNGIPADVYEGGFNTPGEVERDPSLARAFRTFEGLNEDGNFEMLATQLYGPMLDWVKSHVVAEAHDAAGLLDGDASAPAAATKTPARKTAKRGKTARTGA